MANPKNVQRIVPITNVFDVNSVMINSPIATPSIIKVDGICATLKNSAFFIEFKIVFSNLAIYGNRYKKSKAIFQESLPVTDA